MKFEEMVTETSMEIKNTKTELIIIWSKYKLIERKQELGVRKSYKGFTKRTLNLDQFNMGGIFETT